MVTVKSSTVGRLNRPDSKDRRPPHFGAARHRYVFRIMKAVRIHSFGGPEVLEIEDAPRPEPREGEILIRVRAAGVNPVDYKIRSGGYKRADIDLPLTSREALEQSYRVRSRSLAIKMTYWLAR